MEPRIVGAVLVGGESRRMGRDKARIPFEGEPLAARAAAALASACENRVLVTSIDRRPLDLGLPEIRDRHADSGPLAGVEAALAWAAPRSVFVLACDLPRVDEVVVGRLVAAAEEEADVARAWVARRGGRPQPLCALYTTACHPIVERRLRRGERSMHALLEDLEVDFVSLDDLEPDPLLNLNTPADRAAATGGSSAVST